MDVNAKQFDDDFYDLRCKIKDLERRLGNILTQSFDDAATLGARFRLLFRLFNNLSSDLDLDL
jgi:dynein heavy chain